MDNKSLKEALKEIDKELEDKAWAEKKAIYGNKFNEKKFYELDAFWPNFWAWVSFLWIPALMLFLIWRQHS